MNGMDLKLMRIKKKVKASDIAMQLGVTKAYISMMENNKRAIPSYILHKWKILLLKGDKM